MFVARRYRNLRLEFESEDHSEPCDDTREREDGHCKDDAECLPAFSRRVARVFETLPSGPSVKREAEKSRALSLSTVMFLGLTHDATLTLAVTQ